MELIQNGFSCEYEMNVFMKLFFEKDEDVLVKTEFFYENDIINVKAIVEYQGKEYFGEYQKNYKKTKPRQDKIVFRCYTVRAFIMAAEKIKNVSIPWGALSGIRPAKVVRQMREEGLSYNEIREDLREIFGVEEEKIDLAIEVAKKEEDILKDIDKRSVSIYIGIPFCPSKCLYCSFVSSDLKHAKRYVKDYILLLEKEIEKTANIIKELDFYIENIYIGGGTPTSVNEEELEYILKNVEKHFDLKNLKEYTLEAGRPDTITREKLKIAKKYGINRISINPQTMNEKTLNLVGRHHSEEMVKDAFLIAREEKFLNINMDLIAGLPSEKFEDFKYSLDEVIKLKPENITVHSLCIKRAAALRFSEFGLAQSEEVDKMLSYTQKRMKEIGKKPYYMYRQKNISGNLENVGYADEGKHSFYNVNIMEEVQNIIAIGGGGTSKLVKGDRIERIFNFKDPAEYIRRFDEIIDKKDEFVKIYNEM